VDVIRYFSTLDAWCRAYAKLSGLIALKGQLE